MPPEKLEIIFIFVKLYVETNLILDLYYNGGHRKFRS